MGGIIVGIGGASGIIYSLRFLEIICNNRKYFDKVYVIYTNNAVKVAEYEMGIDLVEKIKSMDCIDGIYNSNSWRSPIASSSSTIGYNAVIIPCSMDIVANLAMGLQHRLLERAVYNVARMGGKVVLVIRETPLSTIDLRNLYTLSSNGYIILPASPGFYIKPRTIMDLVDFIVGKVLDLLGIKHGIYRRWGSLH